MNSYINYKTSSYESLNINTSNEDLDYLLMEKRLALSSLDYIEEEAERCEEKFIFERKIQRINSNCFLVSCRSETESEYANMNDSTNDYM